MRGPVAWIVGLGAALAGLLLAALLVLGWPFVGAVGGGAWAGAHEARVKRAEVHEPMARAMAMLCQSDPAFHGNAFDLQPVPFLPPEVADLRPRHVTIGEDFASVGFGGGHRGYRGFRLRRTAVSGTTSHWALSWHDEATADQEDVPVLFAFELDVSERYGREALMARAMETFEARAKTDGRYAVTRARARFLLAHGEGALARETVRAHADRFPERWLEVLLRYVIEAADDTGAAADRLDAWAAEADDFTRWTFAALAFLQAGAVDRAEAAARRALAHGPDDVRGVPYNARHRGAPVARGLLEAGRGETAAAFAEALLAYEGAGDYLEGVLEALAAGRTADAPPMPLIYDGRPWDPFDPYEGIDLARLTGR